MRPATLALLFLLSAPAALWADSVRDGEYIFRASGCYACHTDDKNKGAPLAGGRALETPVGTFYSPNITPDPDTGIGRWSEADFLRALREGVSPAGAHYYPAFPYPAYTLLTEADLKALRAYLFSLRPVRQPNREHDLPWYFRFRPLLALWKWLFFTPGPYVNKPEQSAIWNRGAYLVTAASHCGECHTPRYFFGAFRRGMFLAGTRNGPAGSVIPNITPHKTTGIGRWKEKDLVEYLETGATPSGDFAGDLMAEVIDHGTRYLKKADRQAIAVYVFSQPPLDNAVRGKKKPKKKDEFEY
jgi:mono/diheme cytochrome c family protein